MDKKQDTNLIFELEFDELYIEFDLIGTGSTNKELSDLMDAMFMHKYIINLSINDKPRIRQITNDTIDMLNKNGQISDRLAQNITYTIERKDERCI